MLTFDSTNCSTICKIWQCEKECVISYNSLFANSLCPVTQFYCPGLEEVQTLGLDAFLQIGKMVIVRADLELRAGEESMRDGLKAGQTHGFAY